jgi:hypothetical protein
MSGVRLARLRSDVALLRLRADQARDRLDDVRRSTASIVRSWVRASDSMSR